jgi:mRNA interferase MazF
VILGDVVSIDFGTPIGSEAGFVRPAVVLTSDGFLRYRPSSVFVVPLTSAPRPFPSHVEVAADPANGLDRPSWAQVEQLRAVAIERCGAPMGNVGPAVTHQLLDVLAMITGMP